MTYGNDENSHASDGIAQVAPLPRISLQAFCETPELMQLLQEAARDRRMDKAHIKVNMGGAAAAVESYRTAPTPNVIVIESNSSRGELIAQLEALAEFCDSGTKVIVVGSVNDITLYRELIARGVSDYLVQPFGVLDFIQTLSVIYQGDRATPVGRVIAVTGCKGGVGASCIAHNLAWSISRDLDVSTVIVDLDLAFGTAGLDFNQDPPQGVAEAIFSPDRLDANLVDRLLSKCADKLSILAAPATLDRAYDLQETVFDGLIDILRATMPIIVLDVPHIWNAWSRRMLQSADEAVVVGAPDLASLRNAKSMIDTLNAARKNDHRARLVLNGVGMHRRPEIEIADFAKAVETDPAAVIPFDAKLFGTASNNGQMIAEVDADAGTTAIFHNLGRVVTGRMEIKRERKSLLEPILELMKKKAS